MHLSEEKWAVLAQASASAVGQTLEEFTRQAARERGFPDVRSFLESNIRATFPKMPQGRIRRLARIVEADHHDLVMATLPPTRTSGEQARTIVDDQRAFLRRIERAAIKAQDAA